jgi:zona occludens toxin (predicted ATPase)
VSIRIITGNPGSGKSLLVVDEIAQLAKLANRPIYTNITGLVIPGVQALPDDADWNLLPDRSLVVFDECQDIEVADGVKPYAATGSPGMSRDPRLANLRTHRKREFDLWFVSQHPSFIHHDIRKIADEHVHMLRVMGLNRSTRYVFSGSYCPSPEKPEERRRGDKDFWRFPKRSFGLYHSANGHHFKFKMPRKVAMVAVAICCTCALGVYFLAGRVGLGETSALVADAQAAEVDQAAAAARPDLSLGEFDWTHAGTVRPIAGCAVLTHSCRCWAADGEQLALSEGQCRNVASRPLPLSFARSDQDGGVGGGPPTVTPSLAVPAASQGGGGPVGIGTAPSHIGPPGDASGAVW